MRCWMLRCSSLLILSASLTACGTISFDITSKTQGLVVDGCPRIKNYTPEQNNLAADELERLGIGAILKTYMSDYKGLRDQVRACREAAKPEAS